MEIHCEDIYPMDLGTGTFTDFKMDESVVGYIAENIDLFDCDMALVHSHHVLGAFLSNTDLQTIWSEGNDTNCFVSLVVDTKGTYVAALTRKIKEKKQVTTADMGSSYEFFGEGSVALTDSQSKTSTVEVIDREVIEYFMLDVQIEHVDNPLAYLDTRFDEIQEVKKKKVVTTSTVVNPPVVKASENGNHSPWIPNSKNHPYVPSTRESLERGSFDFDFDEDYSFQEWQKKQNKVKEPTLFSENEMAEMVDTSGWEPDPTIIHKLVCQIITCSFIISDDIDLKQWITRWMNKKYKEIFGPDCDESVQFQEWKEFIIEFMLNEYILLEDNIPEELMGDYDLLNSKIAAAMYSELYQYNTKEDTLYLNDYMEVLTRYIYE